MCRSGSGAEEARRKAKDIGEKLQWWRGMRLEWSAVSTAGSGMRKYDRASMTWSCVYGNGATLWRVPLCYIS